MEIDVLYRVSKDLCHQYINRFVKQESINLAFYRTCHDQYINKKTIWNAASRITPGGIFCIQVGPENISDVIRLVQEQGYKFKVIYCDCTWALSEGVATYLLAYKNEIAKPKINTLLRIDSIEELGQKIICLCAFVDLILCIGDSVLPFVEMSKRLGRTVIAFGDNNVYVESACNQGIREIIL